MVKDGEDLHELKNLGQTFQNMQTVTPYVGYTSAHARVTTSLRYWVDNFFDSVVTFAEPL